MGIVWVCILIFVQLRDKILVGEWCCEVVGSCEVQQVVRSKCVSVCVSHWAHVTVRRFICVYLCFCFILHSYCIIVSVVGWTG